MSVYFFDSEANQVDFHANVNSNEFTFYLLKEELHIYGSQPLNPESKSRFFKCENEEVANVVFNMLEKEINGIKGDYEIDDYEIDLGWLHNQAKIHIFEYQKVKWLSEMGANLR